MGPRYRYACGTHVRGMAVDWSLTNLASTLAGMLYIGGIAGLSSEEMACLGTVSGQTGVALALQLFYFES